MLLAEVAKLFPACSSLNRMRSSRLPTHWIAAFDQVGIEVVLELVEEDFHPQALFLQCLSRGNVGRIDDLGAELLHERQRLPRRSRRSSRCFPSTPCEARQCARRADPLSRDIASSPGVTPRISLRSRASAAHGRHISGSAPANPRAVRPRRRRSGRRGQRCPGYGRWGSLRPG